MAKVALESLQTIHRIDKRSWHFERCLIDCLREKYYLGVTLKEVFWRCFDPISMDHSFSDENFTVFDRALACATYFTRRVLLAAIKEREVGIIRLIEHSPHYHERLWPQAQRWRMIYETHEKKNDRSQGKEYSGASQQGLPSEEEEETQLLSTQENSMDMSGSEYDDSNTDSDGRDQEEIQVML